MDRAYKCMAAACAAHATVAEFGESVDALTKEVVGGQHDLVRARFPGRLCVQFSSARSEQFSPAFGTSGKRRNTSVMLLGDGWGIDEKAMAQPNTRSQDWHVKGTREQFEQAA